jgi:hypothetical protein
MNPFPVGQPSLAAAGFQPAWRACTLGADLCVIQTEMSMKQKQIEVKYGNIEYK